MEYYYHIRSRLDYWAVFHVYSIIWRLENRNPVRMKPLEVLALGPSRSGTDSLRIALKMLGYEDTYHGWLSVERQQQDAQIWCKLLAEKFASRKFGEINPEPIDVPFEKFEAILSGCTAVTDNFPAYFGPELMKAYPSAKVILNRRKDIDAWDRSMAKGTVTLAKSWAPWIVGFFIPELFWLHRLARMSYLNQYYGDSSENRKRGYEEHFKKLEARMKPGTYLNWSVEDGWEPLCKFLDKPIPDTPFPHANTVAEFDARNDAIIGGYIRIAMTNFIHLSIWMAVGVAIGKGLIRFPSWLSAERITSGLGCLIERAQGSTAA